MKLFRSILFWAHLVAGLIAGLFIGVMCFTGAALAFEDELVSWSERDARQVTPPADAARLSFSDIQTKLREAQPEFRAAAMTLRNDSSSAVTFTAGREGGFYVNPYTGEVRQPASTAMHGFMDVMIAWHRFLGREGEQRATGKLVNGICNIAFAVLAITGLYLWWPRSLTWRGFRAVTLFNWKMSGKARDFNWHNVIGLWTAPVLIVLTLTAIPISFRWGGDLIYKLVGETPPPAPQAGGQGPGGAAAAPAFDIKRPSPDARPLGYDAIVPRIQEQFPNWSTLSFRTGGNQRGQRPAPAGATAQNAPTASSPAAPTPSASATAIAASTTNASREGAARGENRRAGGGAGNAGPTGEAGGRGAAPQPLTVTIREAGSWPRTATTTLTLNPFTGEELKREGYATLTPARQVRSWTRYLHTGQALGWGGQLVAGIACLGGCFLVYTGFALSWRRFFGKKPKSKSPARAAAAEPVSIGS